MEEIKNKLKFGGTEYTFATDTAPEEGSTNFITSGAVAEWVATLSQFTGTTTQINSYNKKIPNSETIWAKYKDVVYYDPSAQKLYYYNGTTKTYINSITITVTS